jgi:hypothetical protein
MVAELSHMDACVQVEVLDFRIWILEFSIFDFGWLQCYRTWMRECRSKNWILDFKIWKFD